MRRRAPPPGATSALATVAAVAAAAAFGLGAGSGCVSLVRTVEGEAPAAPEVRALAAGMPLEAVLGHLGAPLETWRMPDGLLLVYQERLYDFTRVGLDPSRGLRFVDTTQTASSLLSNLHLTLEWGDQVENRLVLIFDEEDRLLAWAFRDAEGRKLP